ncbi:FHA domain-containing protein [Mycobacterium simiae]|uniref:FHA domain-containing protein n=1 Tax=Mycobacterium simiae TaxID=1784 RepID=A0A5B1BMF5_MYCSI|nr:FHA domain-containing protein [Mycobacterium simiae]KAA1248573.1 FHA domain-containing protein [Mycobacterium simiae]
MQTTESTSPSPASTPLGRRLAIRAGDRTYTVHEDEAPILIGRDVSARVCIDDDRISRHHVRLDHLANGWIAVDQSRNGIFIDGARQSQIPINGTTTILLGHPLEGIPVAFTEGISAQPYLDTDADDAESTMVNDTTDPGIARAGKAVANRRKELDLSQRHLAANGVMSAGSLIALEKGRVWPRPSTLAKLEEVLEWPRGHIAGIRYQRVAPNDERTMTLTNISQAPLMTDVVEVALDNLTEAIKDLPEVSDPAFSARAGRILANLRRIEASAAQAARAASGDPSVARVLGAVRRPYKDLMLRAARAPGATLGQRVFAARHRAELSADELANAAGVPVDVVMAAEAEAPLDADAVAALSAALNSLTGR